MLKHKNYMLGNGKIPQQLFGDYCQNVESSAYGAYASETKGQTVFSNLRGLMSNEMEQSFMQGMVHLRKLSPDLTGQMRFYPAWRHEPHHLYVFYEMSTVRA